MLFLKIVFSALFLILIGGFAYFAITDIPVRQVEKTETYSASDFRS